MSSIIDFLQGGGRRKKNTLNKLFDLGGGSFRKVENRCVKRCPPTPTMSETITSRIRTFALSTAAAVIETFGLDGVYFVEIVKNKMT